MNKFFNKIRFLFRLNIFYFKMHVKNKKSEQVDLIGQSFETNKEIIIRQKEQGINYDNKEWSKQLELQNDIVNNSLDINNITKISKEEPQNRPKAKSMHVRPSSFTTTILGIKQSPIKKVNKHKVLNKIHDRFYELSIKAQDLSNEIHEFELEKYKHKENLDSSLNESFDNESIEETKSKILTIDANLDKLSEFKIQNIDTFSSQLKGEIKNLDDAISEQEPKTYSDLDRLEIVKKDFRERWGLSMEEYNQSLEGKAIIAEDFKGKLVDRAEQVAEQEEFVNLVEQISVQMENNFATFDQLKDNYDELQSKQQMLHDQQKERMHIASSLNMSQGDLLGGESMWGDEMTIIMTQADLYEEREMQWVIDIENQENEIDDQINNIKKCDQDQKQISILGKFNISFLILIRQILRNEKESNRD